MKPPICHLCKRNIGSLKSRHGQVGKLVQFADFSPLPDGVIGHPHGLQWFCADHVAAAQSLAGHTEQQALDALRRQFGTPAPAGTTTVIERSRVKLVLLTLGALIGIAVGLWQATVDEVFIRDMRRSTDPMLARAIGAACVLMSVAVGAFAVRKLFDTRPGLILSPQGLTDHASLLAAGLIPWSEITHVSICAVRRSRSLVIHVRDPDEYLRRGNALTRAIGRGNLRLCGSPITIASSTLRIGFDELFALVVEWLGGYGHGD